MKKLELLVRVLSAISFVSVASRTCAQGTIYFANYDNRGVNAPVYESDGLTALSGPQFQAELLAGAMQGGLAQIATTGFLSGSGAGYFIAGTQTINTVGPGNIAWVQVDVWNTASGNTFAEAQASGLPNSWWQSAVFSVVTGGGTVNPTPPAPLTGLGNSPVFLNGVPEPSVFALFGIGVAGALLRARTRSL